jgi:hypothetical protein
MNTSKAQHSSSTARQGRLQTGYQSFGLTKRFPVILFIGGLAALTGAGLAGAAEGAETNKVQVADGIFLPRRPVAEAIAKAMEFLKKADGGYVPGRIDGNLAGYFTSAFVNEDRTLDGAPASWSAVVLCRFCVPPKGTANAETPPWAAAREWDDCEIRGHGRYKPSISILQRILVAESRDPLV